MRFAIAYSLKDSAGINIIENLKKIFLPQMPIISLKKETIFSDDISAKKFPQIRNVDFLVFASKHQSVKKKLSLSLHAPGNWRDAEFGGKSGKVCKTSAFVLKYLFQQLHQNSDLEEFKEIKEKYSLTLEATHHGPLISIPCCFIEIGSSEEEWKNKKAGKLIAKTIASLQSFDESKIKELEWIPALGIGGPHYAPNFNRIQLNSKYAIGHIIPQYSLPLTPSMLKEAEEKTIENLKEVIIDWKGCGKSEDRKRIIEIITSLGLTYKRTSHIL